MTIAAAVAPFIFAEVGVETIAGGTVTGMLVMVMVAFLRRTKDTDERQDEMARLLADAAAQREKKAWEERDRALEEINKVRTEQRAYYERLLAEQQARHERELERERARNGEQQ